MLRQFVNYRHPEFSDSRVSKDKLSKRGREAKKQRNKEAKMQKGRES